MEIDKQVNFLNPELIKINEDFTNTKIRWNNLFNTYNNKELDEDFFKDFFKVNNEILFIISIVSLINSTNNSQESSDLLKNLSKEYSELNLNIYTDKKIYNQYKKALNKEFVQNNNELKFLISKTLNEFNNNGVNLIDNEKSKFKQLNDRLIELINQYNLNLLESKKHLSISCSTSDITDLDKKILEQVSPFVTNDKVVIPFSSGLFGVILKNSTNELLRKEIYEAIATIATGKYDNSPILNEIVTVRQEKALLLGHKSAAHYAMLNNMITEPGKVFEFIEDLNTKFMPAYIKESNMINDFGKNLLNRELKSYDRNYVINEILKSKYEIDTNNIKEYFPVSYVLEKTFKIFGDLFDIEFQISNNKNIWHKDVLQYEVKEKNGESLGSLYLDLFMRDNKRGGACCGSLNDIDEYSFGKKILTNTYIICNFVKSTVPDEETFLNHSDVLTFYHELGHALHHFLAKNKISFLNGTNLVQGDAVELPSQFLEHFCYDAMFLREISKHRISGEALHEEDIVKLKNARSFLEPTSIVVRHALSSYVDMKIYSEVGVIPEEVELEAIKKFVKHSTEYENFKELNTLFHIFTAGYEAGLYFYKWADIMAYDTYKGVLESGDNLDDIKSYMRKFKDLIYAPAGYENFMDHYIKFRGREPSIESMIEILGLNKNDNKIRLK